MLSTHSTRLGLSCLLSIVAVTAFVWSMSSPEKDVAERPSAGPTVDANGEGTPAAIPKPPPHRVDLDDPDPRVQSVAEAYRTGEHPERLSPLVDPAPFDPVAWRRDPDAYLNVIEPGRVYQTHPPGRGVPILTANGPSMYRCQPYGEVTLEVAAVSGAPVSFLTSFGGIFRESKLN
ncbi:MAG: hypothetical protein ACOCXJ_08560, partial [Planctomycetota bacterium]